MKTKQLIITMVSVLTTAGWVSAAPLPLTEADNGRTNSASIGGEIEIVLKGNPTTGYSWETAAFSTNIIKQIGTAQYLPDDASAAGRMPRVGVGGRFIFRFQAVGSGPGFIKLIYRRPWETTAYDKVYSVILDVKTQ